MSYKDATNEKLLALYKLHGAQSAISVAKAMLESKTHKTDMHFHSHLHGEICETVLEILVLDFFKRYNLPKQGWFYKKGLILKDVNNPGSGYFTELDLTVFTPQKIFAFECKSYGGDKKITDKCMIRKKRGGTCDVYDQHEKHFKVLSDQVQPFRIVSTDTRGFAPYQLALFDYALGITQDTRSVENKIIMPCLDDTNVTNIFKTVENKPVLWDINRLKKVLDIIDRKSDENRERHLKYVMGLHGPKS